ncbi:MAG: hypothetical protein CMJ54_07420 [Planctomycetaceae bacterium]|nr:hypothetical protein [Planctomycetaceae bacterium]
MRPLEPCDAIPGRGRILLRAAAAIDASRAAAPATILLEDARIVAIDTPEAIGVPSVDRIVELPTEIVCPAMVNAHAHLDLTGIGPVPCDAGFDAWLDRIRTLRPTAQDDIAEAVRAGVDASLAGGVAAIGDISGDRELIAAATLAESGLAGTAFIEFFGIGRREVAAVSAIRRFDTDLGRRLESPGFRIGIQPHAPYSCGPAVYAAATETSRPVSTHLAETPAEAMFTTSGTGPFLDLLRRIGGITDDAGMVAVSGRHPIDQLLETSPAGRWLVAHLNYPSEPGEPEEVRHRRFDGLARAGITVVFCPRASRFLGHPRPGRVGHPWRSLLEAGVEVALGTDGMPCLDTPGRLGTLDEIRLLRPEATDVDPTALMRMATTAGARGLGLDPAAFTLDPGPVAGLLAITTDPARPIEGLFEGRSKPRWLLGPDRGIAAGGPASRRVPTPSSDTMTP